MGAEKLNKAVSVNMTDFDTVFKPPKEQAHD